jgi:hypothetical protein
MSTDVQNLTGLAKQSVALSFVNAISISVIAASFYGLQLRHYLQQWFVRDRYRSAEVW